MPVGSNRWTLSSYGLRGTLTTLLLRGSAPTSKSAGARSASKAALGRAAGSLEKRNAGEGAGQDPRRRLVNGSTNGNQLPVGGVGGCGALADTPRTLALGRDMSRTTFSCNSQRVMLPALSVPSMQT